ncbi:hypothetical protein GCM10010317_034340 [Streptomyces mirabilis]|nr:hypothetical protein GCM10010317_034340 [Streptomyces mirabilis]
MCVPQVAPFSPWGSTKELAIIVTSTPAARVASSAIGCARSLHFVRSRVLTRFTVRGPCRGRNGRHRTPTFLAPAALTRPIPTWGLRPQTPIGLNGLVLKRRTG